MATRVLIVDDNPDIVALLRANLQMEGFATAEAANGKIALRKIKEELPDVVVLDLMMPVMDGWGVLEALHGREQRPPVIVVSAIESASSVDRAQRLGVTAYVTKPFNLSGLVELVQAVTGSPARHPQADAPQSPRSAAG